MTEPTDSEKVRMLDDDGLPLYEMTENGWQPHSLRGLIPIQVLMRVFRQGD